MNLFGGKISDIFGFLVIVILCLVYLNKFKDYVFLCEGEELKLDFKVVRSILVGVELGEKGSVRKVGFVKE